MKRISLLLALALTGCVTIPIPPTGPDAGRYGYVTVGYVPNALTTPYLNQGYTK